MKKILCSKNFSHILNVYVKIKKSIFFYFYIVFITFLNQNQVLIIKIIINEKINK